LSISTKLKERSLVVKISGDIDHHLAEAVRDRIDRDYVKHNAKNIIFDFSKVKFMDSSGIGMVIGRFKNAKKQGGNVMIAAVNPEIERIFIISGLHKIIKLYDSVDNACRYS